MEKSKKPVMILAAFALALSLGLATSIAADSSAQMNVTTNQTGAATNATEMSNQTDLGGAGNISFFRE
jgi:hypothetical protein